MKIFFLLLLTLMVAGVQAQQVIPLYPGIIPNAKANAGKERVVTGDDGGARISKVSEPTLTVYLPPSGKSNGAAVIVCPGGGYARLAIKKEGDDVAQQLSEWGITAFVLKYRLPDDTLMQDKEIGPLQDAQRAIQLVRERATEWKLNKNKVGIMGFSAGGHLAGSLGTHYKNAVISNTSGINLRPDFMVLMYPVVSMTDSLAHMGSRTNLLGPSPSKKKITEYSNEMQVTRRTPPTFLVHAKDDKTVKVQNSVAFFDALQKKKVPAEIHLYEKGGHGFGLNNSTSPDKWMDWLKVWLQQYI
ncbi:alpha/beta hydrolase [Segetibacter sp. 3557_3]|uniref:alpha/beta hydrolase n=1 Tax=Segetibacter sp. 3557_3 TaxID=2547429 RepID=UPI0010586960|nr:alpha/beta hydrolase [Segetibacter sp. 3557_3]TDH26441.1 alpha/beta hydrolase [Segetibacter sp. 3557_3]